MAAALPAIYMRDQPPPPITTIAKSMSHSRTTQRMGAAASTLTFPEGVFITNVPVTPSGAGATIERPTDRWVISVVAEIDADGYVPMVVEFFRAGRPVATGRLIPQPETLTITSTHSGSGPGTYRWSFDGLFLRLTVIEDACDERLAVLTYALLERRPFALRFMDAFDEVLAPIVASLDNLEAYFDPRLAPEDLVDWLCTWVAFSPRRDAHLSQRRAHVRGAVQLLREWGTAAGIRHFVAIFAGVQPGQVEIEDSGSVISSTNPRAAIPGPSTQGLTVRVRLQPGDRLQRSYLDRLVTVSKPAHVPHRTEVIAS
jgi:phage tail-like protein